MCYGQYSHPSSYSLYTFRPTSVALKCHYALVAINTSPSFTAPSGKLVVVDLQFSPTIVLEIDLNGQPDAVEVSPDGKWAVIAIENERDEDLGDGEIPQPPPGL